MNVDITSCKMYKVVKSSKLKNWLTFHNQSNLPKNIIQLMVHPVLVAVVWFIMGNITGGYPLGLEPFYPGLLTSLIIYLLNIKYAIRDRT